MFRTVLSLVCVIITAVSWSDTIEPTGVATVVVHGFNIDGADTTGMFGLDEPPGDIAPIAALAGLPTGYLQPNAPNQLAYTTYYGDQYPPYYTADDIADIEAVTDQYGGGVPRYALIIGKYAKEVMRRSGAKQVNLFGVSFGGLISRWIIEKDVEGLASSGKIARWIVVEGVVAGNWAATFAEDLFSNYDVAPIDIEHMNYSWVENNIHSPRRSSSSSYLGQFPSHFWLASDDDYNEMLLTYASGEANDGVVLIDDGYLRNLPVQSRYLGMPPTISSMHTNHESTKDFTGIRPGVIAQLTGRTRVTITLEDVRVRNEFDGGVRGDGEYVFGLRVFSPEAETLYSIDRPIHQLRWDDNNLPFHRLAQDTTHTINQIWFDDMILPHETELRLETNVDEVDRDYIYEILESQDVASQALTDASLTVSVAQPGVYNIDTTDWRGLVRVQITNYPAFIPAQATARHGWELYN